MINQKQFKFTSIYNHEKFEEQGALKSTFTEIKPISIDLVFKIFDEINKDTSHFTSTDDICTPMSCVRKMVDYVPEEFWQRKSIRVLDPCSGNGNFGAYCYFKTKKDNIWFNELNVERFNNCKNLLTPTHINNEDFFAMSGSFLGTWDLIIGNPPYSGSGNKNRSLSNQFIEKSISILNNSGYLCFVTPNNWMTYNNNNTTLKMLLSEGSFLIIDNDAKKYFPSVGSSFTIFLWQKGIRNRTKVYNNYLLKDIQNDVIIYDNLPFIPLYISQNILDIELKIILNSRNNFDYRCDLHNHTKKNLLSDVKDNIFKYRTIHTARKTRFSSIKQDIFDKWIIVIPLSTYYIPYIDTKVNVTQSVGYIPFDEEQKAKEFLYKITKPELKLIIHLTRYGNFNNIMVLRHLDFFGNYKLSTNEINEIDKLVPLIKY